ncbi:probable cytochrome P450 6a13 [Pollicipes pollicipes]|uniref:probable cytochrome P450 6a13 n=1 Tax=Pollicipes pollicipes TaxID=41117 RepID=UPI001884C0F3|nr:probable cytochrome P450 6a13 [Pollicipes pollicipes]
MIGAVVSLLCRLLGWLLSPVSLAVLAATLGAVYYFLTKDYDFWPSRGVKGPRAKLPWGNEFGPPFVTSMLDFEEWIYYKHGGKKYCGYMELHRPILYIGDMDLIRAITGKDFEHFTSRRDALVSKLFDGTLSLADGKEWKDLRSVLAPNFSASKMRLMHQPSLENAINLSEFLLKETKERGDVELLDAFGRFTMDNIASCAFGVTCNSFKDPNTEFATHAAELFKPPTGYTSFRFVASLLFPKWLYDKLPDPDEATGAFFRRVVNMTIAYREENGCSRRDYLQMLLETKDKDGNRVLTNDSIVAQSVFFFVAGYDTTASHLTYAGYLLATNPDCQRAAQREIDDVLERHGGQLTYEAVSEMTYMDRVLSETLRIYPPPHHLERTCTKDYVLPGTDVHIPRGTLVQMPILMIHRDPEIHPDPLRFDPDRFLPEEKAKRHPCSYLPFGNGPRNCMALRFALFEAKVALIAILRESNLRPGPRTPPPPMPMNTTGFLLSPKKGASYVKVLPRRED